MNPLGLWPFQDAFHDHEVGCASHNKLNGLNFRVYDLGPNLAHLLPSNGAPVFPESCKERAARASNTGSSFRDRLTYLAMVRLSFRNGAKKVVRAGNGARIRQLF